jgi:subtilisin family serine protease/subtilisin-like proprotein convertase family protein
MFFLARRSKPRRKQPDRPLGLEALEDRDLLNASPAAPAIDLSAITQSSTRYNAGDILVQFKPTALAGEAVPTLAGTSAGPQLGLVPGLYEVLLDAGTSVSQALAEYGSDPRVLRTTPDYALTSSAFPNDPQFNQQWAMLNTGQGGGTAGDDIGVTHAWSVTTGSAKNVVALLDTGIDYDQRDLYRNVWINRAEIPKSRLAPAFGGTNPNGIQDYDGDGVLSFRDLNDPRNIGPGKITDVNGDGIIDAADILAPMVRNAQGQDTGKGGWAFPGNTQDGDTAHPNDFIGWNFVANNNNPLDQNGHGTHVAGIIGATGNNGVGVAGVDWQVGLMPVQFLDANGVGNISTFITALGYAVRHGAKISNNSWSGADNDPLLQNAIANAGAAGMIFVAAAGNGGTNNDTSPAYPSSFNLNNIIAVAASDNNDRLASFSNYGPHSVDLAAPGVNIVSTLPHNTYGTMSGTSMATPMVTGVVALVWAEHPTWSYLQVINQVLSSVDPVPALQGKVLTGGVLDAARAVGSATATPVTASVLQVLSSTASGTTVSTLNSIRLTFNSAVSPSALTNTNVALFGPSGQRITFVSFQAVANSGGKQIDLGFRTQSAPGSYTLFVGAGITGTSGLALPSTYTNAFRLGSASLFRSNAPVGVPDLSQVTTSISVPTNLTIGKVTVALNLANSIDGQIVLKLQAPDGTTVVLSNLRGGTGVGFLNTVFDDQAPAAIGSGHAPFTGSFRPDSALGALVGKNATGTWKLTLVDHAPNYHVTLTSWSLTITPAATATSPTAVLPPPAVPAPAVPSAAATTEALAPAASQSLRPTLRHQSAAEFGSAALALQGAPTPLSPASQVPVSAARSAGPDATRAADALFESADGIDRLAELRVMMPHASRPDASADDAAFWGAANETDGADVVVIDRAET